MTRMICTLFFVPICLVVLAGWTVPVRAAAPEEPVVLEEIVVTAARGVEEVRKIPANVSVITAADIEESGATSIVEVLETLESVNVRSYSGNPSQAMVDLRGMGGDNPFGKVLVMLDGRRMNRPDMASINWLQVSPATVERIEVVRGSGSVLYGDAAVAGVINIITKKGEGPPTVDASVMFGSYGLHNERLGVSGSEGTLSYSLSGENLKTFGYRDRSAFSSKGGAFDVGYDATESVRVSLGISFNETEYELPGTLTQAQMAVNRKQAQSPAHLNDESSDRYGNIDLGLETLLGDFGELSLGVAYGTKTIEADMPSSWPPNQYNRYDMGTLALTPKYVLENSVMGHANTFTAGVDFYDETMDLEQFSDAQRTMQTHAVDFTKRSVGFYIRDEFHLAPSLILSGGFRAERATIEGGYRDFSAPTARFNPDRKIHRGRAWETGLTWLFGERSNAFVRCGTFYRYPFLDEQASYLGFPITFLDDLEQEKGRNYEAGTRLFFLDNRLRVGMTAYLIDMRDQIVYVGLWPTGQNRNLDRTRHQGLELNARYRLADIAVVEGNATFSSSKFREGPYSGNDVPLAPRATAYLALDVYLPGGVTLRPEVHRTGDAFLADDLNNDTEKLGGRTLGNLYLYYKPSVDETELSAFLGIENITDEEYVTYGYDMAQWGAANTFCPAPGRTVKAGLSVRF